MEDSNNELGAFLPEAQEPQQENVAINLIKHEDFEFTIDNSDVVFVLTRNNSIYPNSTNNMISKSFMLKDLSYINLELLAEGLTLLKIERLNIIDINKKCSVNKVNVTKSNSNPLINFIEINNITFVNLMLSDTDFLEKNKHTLYILRDGNFAAIKTLFSKVTDCKVNICKGNSQKSHLLSPLDFRLSNYIMALFNFDYKKICYLNSFSEISKDKYLS